MSSLWRKFFGGKNDPSTPSRNPADASSQTPSAQEQTSSSHPNSLNSKFSFPPTESATVGLQKANSRPPSNASSNSSLTIRCGHLSITGNFRENNEDSYTVDDDFRFFIVADGMGGQSAGEKASAIAVDIVPRILLEHLTFQNDESEKVISVIDEAIKIANSEIMSVGESNPKFMNMGTTIAFVVTIGERCFFGNVGDSRVYRLRNNEFSQLTTDHSLTQALVDAGTISPQEALSHRYKNVLYRYLGTRDGSNTGNSREMELLPGDCLLICSDGVTDGAKPDTIKDILINQHDPQEAAQKVIKAAEQGGSKDNITCVVIKVDRR